MLYDCEESLTKPQNEGGCRPPEKLVMGPIKSKIVIWEKLILFLVWAKPKRG